MISFAYLIKFSIHGGTPETYKSIHGKDDFERVIKNLKMVDKYRKENNKNLKIYVAMVETFANKSETETLRKIVESHIDGWDHKKIAIWTYGNINVLFFTAFKIFNCCFNGRKLKIN